MPWLNEKDPYRVWVSEIILQQTRVQQGINYYQKFIEAFPTVRQLARADIDRVLRVWEGLGYFTRARNLHAAAKLIVEKHNGQIPADYESLLRIPGVGPYTASAIAAFAFNIPKLAMDANALRVAARIFGIRESVDRTKTRKNIERLLLSHMPKDAPATFNQALMNFGAMQCTPQNPACSACIFNAECWAFQEGKVKELPVRNNKGIRKEREIHYFYIEEHGKIWINKRCDDDIWKGLYQLPNIEITGAKRRSEKAIQAYALKKYNINIDLITKQLITTHLSHQTIHAHFYIGARIKSATKKIMAGNLLVDAKNLAKFAFPKIIRVYLKNQNQKSC